MGVLKFRWDESWKVFLDVKMPTFIPFLKWLTGVDVAGYSVTDDSYDVVEENVEIANILGTFRLDKIFRIHIDMVNRVIHLEFQSTFDKEMVERVVVHGLAKATKVFHEDGSAVYYMPTAFIVSVKDNKYRSMQEQKLTLHFDDYAVEIKYPVVNAMDKVPYLRELMTAKDPDEARKYFELLADSIPDMKEDSEEYQKFCAACGKILDQDVYDKLGIQDTNGEELSKVVKVLQGDGLTISQRAKREGFAEGSESTLRKIIEQIKTNTGWSEDEVIRFLKSGVVPTGKNNDFIHTMDLK